MDYPEAHAGQDVEAIRKAIFEGLQFIPQLSLCIQQEEGRVAYCTPGLLRSLGYSCDDVRNGRIPFFDAEDSEAAAETTRRRFAGELAAADWETRRFRRKNGSLGHVAVTGQPVDFRGKPALVLATMDITQHVAVTERLRRTLEATIEAMALTVETRDPYTAGHQKRVSALACAIAKELGVAAEVIEGLEMAALIHDLGKLCVPPDILSKPESLSYHEFGIVKTHPEVAYNILKVIEFPWPVAEIVLQHHERLDGSGYPRHLADDEILLESQILGVADVVDAMASHRPYRPQLGVDTALTEISNNSGTLFSEDVVDACLKVFAGDPAWLDE